MGMLLPPTDVVQQKKQLQQHFQKLPVARVLLARALQVPRLAAQCRVPHAEAPQSLSHAAPRTVHPGAEPVNAAATTQPFGRPSQ